MPPSRSLPVWDAMVPAGRGEEASFSIERDGINKAVVAVLLVISVKNVTAKAIMAMTTIYDNRVTPDRDPPIASLIPVTAKAFAIAIPPANNKSTPQ